MSDFQVDAGSGADLLPLVIEYTGAFNARDADRLVELVADDFRFTAPHATVEGREGLREFVARQTFGVGLRIRHVRFYARGETVVAEDQTEFVSADTGDVLGSEDAVAVFSVRDGRIAEVTVHDNRRTALDAAGVSEDDLVA